MSVYYNFVHEKIKKSAISVKYCKLEQQPVDMLTKAFKTISLCDRNILVLL